MITPDYGGPSAAAVRTAAGKENAVLPHIGLYYPYIHVRDERWLKTAALYWRELARVVPDGYRLSDSRTARVLTEELGFVTEVSPGATARQVAPMFLELLDRHADALRAAGYGASDAWGERNLHTAATLDPTPPRSLRHPSGEGRSTRPERARVAASYWDEFTPELREALLATGLATDARRTPSLQARRSLLEGRWVAMDAALAWVYKCAFVEALAAQGRYTPTTDQPDAHLASDGWDASRIAEVLLPTPGTPGTSASPASPDLSADVVGLLAIRIVVPADLTDIPVEKIVKLRQDHRDEFAAFTGAVSDTVDQLKQELAGTTLPEARERYLEMAVEQRFEAPLRALRAAMKGQGVSTVYSAANVKFEVPALAAAAGGAGFLAGQQPLIGGAVGAALAFASLRHTHAQQTRALKAQNPAAYLLAVQRGLTPPSLLRRITRFT
ncbi:DUF6236 family protein [Streptomyces sp. NPDC057623]|uniref:DUF6236 family protein n=1 Tax=Streptomyces sp. NPDC057623 TaxID=3346187 RepID=UPI0036BC8124